jgi:enoyl-CoA hydratase/carnithine racemase
MIRVACGGAIASIRLDREASRNALDALGWRALAAAIGQVGRSEARLLLVGSAVEGAFCSGSDLGEIAALASDPAARAPFRAMMREAIDGLAALPIPTVAAIDGDCFGAGVALALGCDIRIAGPRARFAVTPAKLAIAYPHEDVARLAAAVGRGQAARLLFTAEPIDAEEAARIGLVERACGSAEQGAIDMAGRIAANEPGSLALLKAMLNGSAKEANDAAFDACFGGPAFRARLAAFHDRRKSDGSPD